MDLKIRKKLKEKSIKKERKKKEEKKDGGLPKLCIWIMKDLLWERKKKRRAEWIVDLKLSKRLEGKWEKKNGLCQVVYLKCKKLSKKKIEKKKDGVSQVVDLKLTRN